MVTCELPCTTFVRLSTRSGRSSYPHVILASTDCSCRSVSTQQIYTVVLEIRDTLTGPDTRWTYLQAPFRVEDALGFQFPVPSEYDYDMLITIIQRRFQKGAGSLDVRAGNYELCKTKKSSELVTAGTRLTPGTAITMAIIIFTPRASNASCPMPGCGSSKATPCPGGAFIWYVARTLLPCHVQCSDV